MNWPVPPKRERLTNVAEVNAAIAHDIRECRTRAGVTLDALGSLFNEQRASINKHENKTNQIHVAKYLLIINNLWDSSRDHPAHILVAAIGITKLRAMLSDKAPQARLAGYLDLIDATRGACPNHPALPLCDYLLYRRA